MRLGQTLVAVFVFALSFSHPPAEAAPKSTAPKLVVLIAVDQMRGDYIDQFEKNWKHGLRRLVDHGAWFRKGAYPYLGTVTCPGHTTIGTGSFPATHGMILNGWWDRSLKKVIACNDDSSVSHVSYGTQVSRGGVGDSAKYMMVPTLADEMRSQLSPVPRVVSFSMKARAAIGLAGHGADALTWFEGGNWVTSTAYGSKPVAFLQKFMDAHPIAPSMEMPWTKMLAANQYLYSDDAAEEAPPEDWSKSFPHPLKRSQARLIPASATTPAKTPPPPPSPYALWEYSPGADRYLAQMAIASIESMKLGQGKGTDFLSISFSTLDRVGHQFGPRSHEVQDILAHLDVTMGELLTALDKRVGAKNYVLGFSADHGVAAFPEQLKAEGADAGRLSPGKIGETVNAVLVKAFGPGKYVASMQYTEIYLTAGTFDRVKEKPGLMKEALDALRSTPGVLAAYSSDEIRDRAQAAAAGDPVRRAASLSYFAGRSGDIVYAPKPNWIVATSGTTHGSQNEYDQHVPVILLGAHIKPGRYDSAATPADVAPSLAAVCGVKMPRADGKALTDALTR